MRVRVREAKLAGAYAPLVDIAEIMCLLLVIGGGIWEISRGQMTTVACWPSPRTSAICTRHCAS
jgi:hypothetical protein